MSVTLVTLLNKRNALICDSCKKKGVIARVATSDKIVKLCRSCYNKWDKESWKGSVLLRGSNHV